MVLKTSCKIFSTHPPQHHPPLLAIHRQEDAGEVLVHIAGTSPVVQAGPYRQLTLCIVRGAGTRLLKVKMRMVTILMLLTLRTMVTILMILTVRTMVTIPRRPLQPKLPFFWARRAPPLTSPTSGLRWWGSFKIATMMMMVVVHGLLSSVTSHHAYPHLRIYDRCLFTKCHEMRHWQENSSNLHSIVRVLHAQSVSSLSRKFS